MSPLNQHELTALSDYNGLLNRGLAKSAFTPEHVERMQALQIRFDLKGYQ